MLGLIDRVKFEGVAKGHTTPKNWTSWHQLLVWRQERLKKKKKVIGKLDIEKVVGKGEGKEQENFIT